MQTTSAQTWTNYPFTLGVASGDPEPDGVVLWTLIRNLGSSIGVSIVIANLTSGITLYRSQIVETLAPSRIGLALGEGAGLLATGRGPELPAA